MKIELKGFVLTDVAHEYYAIFGKHVQRDQARKNFCRLKHVDLYALEKAVTNIYNRQMELLKKDNGGNGRN